MPTTAQNQAGAARDGAAGDDTVAVVVATFQRPDLLARTLRALGSQTRPPDEIVVVDDHSDDRTPEILRAAAASSPVPVKIVRLERNSGPAVARNRGWREATSSIVAFTDDDCRPGPAWLEHLVPALDRADIAQGRIRPDPKQLDRGQPFTRSLDAGGSPFFETANIAFRRSLLERLGGFDERYRFQGGEDTDLGQRALAQGATATFVPEAEVLHEVFPMTVGGALRHARRCDQLIQAVVQHPSLHRYFRTRLLLLPHHPATLAASAGVAAAVAGVGTRRPVPAAIGVAGGIAASAPWLRLRLRRRPTVHAKSARVLFLPAQLLVELTEVAVIVRARRRHGGRPPRST